MSPGDDKAADTVLADHHQIANSLASGDLVQAQSSVRKHQSRLDQAIERIPVMHPDYFQ